MGRIRKTLALTALAGLVVPPIAAAIAKRRLEPVGDETADEVSLVTIFDGATFLGRAPSFRGGSVLCWYGGLDVDLRSATLDPAGAELRVVSLFGGTRVIVPDGWRVRVRPVGIFGAATDETAGQDAPGPAIHIQAIAVFGAIQVVTRLPDDDDSLLDPAAATASGRAETLARAEADASLEVEAPDDEAAPAEEIAPAEPATADEVAPDEAAEAATADEVAPDEAAEAQPVETPEPAPAEVGPSGSNGT
jgi:hypothetical protein